MRTRHAAGIVPRGRPAVPAPAGHRDGLATIAQQTGTVNWQRAALDYLIAHPVCGYQHGATPAAEPTACSAMALAAHAVPAAARQARHWLAQRQNPDGSVGPTPSQPTPGWSTGLVALAWWTDSSDYAAPLSQAVRWIVTSQGTTPPRNDQVGHDPTIPGWSWVADTHAWVEPTAFHVLALAATGHADHPRVVDGRRLLLDRMLPVGGCNYGNTIVLGQQLRPHLLPTAFALLALAHSPDPDGLIEAALQYVARSVSGQTPLLSLSAALQALAAYDRLPSAAPDFLEQAVQRSLRFRPSPWRQACALMAAAATDSPLVQASQALGKLPAHAAP